MVEDGDLVPGEREPRDLLEEPGLVLVGIVSRDGKAEILNLISRQIENNLLGLIRYQGQIVREACQPAEK